MFFNKLEVTVENIYYDFLIDALAVFYRRL